LCHTSRSVIATTQGMITALLVAAGLRIIGADATTALALGGVAVATAPAATLAVVQEQHADGPLLTIVALDDVIAIVKGK